MLNSRGNKKVKVYAICTLVATVVAVIMRTCCLLWFYDDIGYYTDDILPMSLNIFCVVAVAFFASAFFLIKESDETSSGKEDNLAIRISSALCAIVFASFFVLSVSLTSFIPQGVVSDLLLKLSALMSIVYFLINIFGRGDNRKLQTALGFGIIIWSICVLALAYFDVYIQLNSPDKIMLHLALVSAMAFFVAEFRSFIDSVNKKSYSFCIGISVFFLATEAVPSLIKWLLNGMQEYKYFYYDVVLLALLIYAVARLLSFAFAIDRSRSIADVSETENESQQVESES